MYLMYVVIALLVLLVLWSIFGYTSSRAEQTEYSVLKSEKEYEIRLYPAHIVAETTVQGSYRSALNQGFRIIAGYIFGGNIKKERIAMTAPVIEEKTTSEKIAMTSPVIASIEGESHVITFGMPRSYTLETLPTPTDSRVTIVAIPEKRMAAMQFSGSRSSNQIHIKKQQLLDAVKSDGLQTKGEILYAGYNPPWTPPWMTRNEVMVEVV